MVQLRAIETGLPILQSSNMGFTCIIEPDGSIINTLPQFEQNFLTHSLDLKSINTIYKKVGDLIILISLILILINLAIKRYYLKS